MKASLKVVSRLFAIFALSPWPISVLFFPPELSASIADPSPFDFVQPDGSKVTLRLRGDEFFHWYEDSGGFTLVREGNTFLYAITNAVGQLVATKQPVGKVDPRN